MQDEPADPNGHATHAAEPAAQVGAGEDLLPPIQGPELVFGLVGPIGTDMQTVSAILGEELKRVGYEMVPIHITQLLSEVDHDFALSENPVERRYESYIEAGNQLRKMLRRNDAFALLSVAAIRGKRRMMTGDADDPKPFTAYVLNQFKRPEEIETLRKIYGRSFFQVSAYCSRQNRISSLTKRIAESHYGDKSEDYYRGTAYNLAVKDESEEDNEHGQRLRDTFPLGDVMINADNEHLVRSTISRFLRAYFGDVFVTPTRDEYGSYFARSASLRSADLSRQVGAVVMSDEGEVIAVGCNEVPKAGGGLYWEGDENDYRDFQRGYDSSVKNKTRILQDIMRRMKEGGWLRKQKERLEVGKLVEEALLGSDAVLEDANLMNILEFGRIVHAEMAAISEAARLGRSLLHTTLYCTTFPCHICARHIVAAGIKRVVYIEPYAKSLAAELYPDSIEVEGIQEMPGSKVKFTPFIGIAPQFYDEIFARGKGDRKEAGGKARKWDPGSGRPLLKRFVPSYLSIEAAVLTGLRDRLQRAGLELKH